jgi:rod shape determining protein RodA
MLEKIRHHDWVITIILAIFALFSIVLIFSTTYNAANPMEGQGTVFRQVIFYIIGFAVYAFLSTQNISWLRQKPVVALIYTTVLFALIYVLLFSQERANTQRWILLGPFSFQPAEYAKIAITIITAYIFTYDSEELGEEKYKRSRQIRKLLLSAVTIAAFLLLIFLQPSLGNTLILFAIWLTIVFVATSVSPQIVVTFAISLLTVMAYFKIGVFATISQSTFLDDIWWRIFSLAALGAIFLSLHYLFKYARIPLVIAFAAVLLIGPAIDFTWNNVLLDYHRERVVSYSEGFSSDPTGSDYQVRQSIIAIGAGQLWGRGFLQGTQSSLQTLPFAHTDFIFAALAEQFGFIGVIVLFGLYAILLARLAIIAMNSKDRFAKLIVVGVIAIIAINIFVNTAMNMGLIPVTGVPLPLISHGGSSVLVITISLGLAQMANNSIDSRDLANKFTRIET